MHRHKRFLIALVLGALAGIIGFGLSPVQRLLLGGDVFCLIYLALVVQFAASTMPEGMRAHAADADEGVPLTALLAGLIIIVSVGAIFLTLNSPNDSVRDLLTLILALASVPLGWGTLHGVMAFHYAGLFYGRRGRGGADGGLQFLKTPQPGPWDFLYHAFTVGMTAQVSDVTVTHSAMRRAVLVHGIASFFYNAVILALAVNAAIAFGQ